MPCCLRPDCTAAQGYDAGTGEAVLSGVFDAIAVDFGEKGIGEVNKWTRAQRFIGVGQVEWSILFVHRAKR